MPETRTPRPRSARQRRRRHERVGGRPRAWSRVKLEQRTWWHDGAALQARRRAGVRSRDRASKRGRRARLFFVATRQERTPRQPERNNRRVLWPTVLRAYPDQMRGADLGPARSALPGRHAAGPRAELYQQHLAVARVHRTFQKNLRSMLRRAGDGPARLVAYSAGTFSLLGLVNRLYWKRPLQSSG